MPPRFDVQHGLVRRNFRLLPALCFPSPSSAYASNVPAFLKLNRSSFGRNDQLRTRALRSGPLLRQCRVLIVACQQIDPRNVVSRHQPLNFIENRDRIKRASSWTPDCALRAIRHGGRLSPDCAPRD